MSQTCSPDFLPYLIQSELKTQKFFEVPATLEGMFRMSMDQLKTKIY